MKEYFKNTNFFVNTFSFLWLPCLLRWVVATITLRFAKSPINFLPYK